MTAIGGWLIAALLAARGAWAAPASGLDEAVRVTVDHASVRSHFGPIETALPMSLADFLLDRPDLTADVARRDKLAPYRISRRASGQYRADDGAGTRGLVTLVRRSETERLYFAQGTHSSRGFPAIRADAVVILRLRPVEDNGCQRAVDSTFDVYVKLRSPVLSGMAKVLGPFVRRLVESKFRKLVAVADRLAALAARDPEGFARQAGSSPGLGPGDAARLRALLGGLAPGSCPAYNE